MGWDDKRDFSVLKGQTLTKVERDGDDEIRFFTDTGKKYRMLYNPDCCATCSIEEIHGDLSDLVGSPILMAEESESETPPADVQAARDKDPPSYNESETWTFYKLATIKGSVTIRWYGESNGYYSETADFEEVTE